MRMLVVQCNNSNNGAIIQEMWNSGWPAVMAPRDSAVHVPGLVLPQACIAIRPSPPFSAHACSIRAPVVVLVVSACCAYSCVMRMLVVHATTVTTEQSFKRCGTVAGQRSWLPETAQFMYLDLSFPSGPMTVRRSHEVIQHRHPELQRNSFSSSGL